jgi:hypothetical protein
VTTTDQETAEVGKEPLMTLGTFRSGKHLDWTALDSWRHEARKLPLLIFHAVRLPGVLLPHRWCQQGALCLALSLRSAGMHQVRD